MAKIYSPIRKALVVGINNYPVSPLLGSINDASAVATVLQTHNNGDPNFAVRLCKDVPTKEKLALLIEALFSGDSDISLFYFSGHGFENNLGTYLVTPDAARLNAGVSMNDLLVMANSSKAKNRIIILDCCHSGAAGTSMFTGGVTSSLNQGVTILTASKANEPAMEVDGHGVFTHLLIDALQGGAADLSGHITPGSIYSYIDQSLGAWEQRPVFKTNITEFVSLRKIEAQIPDRELRQIVRYFPSPDHDFQLNPSYEYTNSQSVKHLLLEPYAHPENVTVFQNLQQFHKAGLVTPVGTPYMYFAAMESRSCRLTPLGYHYWRLVDQGKI